MKGGVIDWAGPVEHDQKDGWHSIGVTASSRRDLMQVLDQRLQAKLGFTLATLNLDHVVKICNDVTFRDAYRRHNFITADGRPIVWLSRLASRPIDLIPGSDLIVPLLELAAARNVPVAFFGSSQETLETASHELRSQIAGLRIVTCISPPLGFDPEGVQADEAVQELEHSGARLVVLALGAPKQEIFSIRASSCMPEAGFVSTGAGLDFIAGTQTRAPALVRKLSAEWLWRLLSNPLRFSGRYMRCIAILPSLTASALTTRRAVGLKKPS